MRRTDGLRNAVGGQRMQLPRMRAPTGNHLNDLLPITQLGGSAWVRIIMYGIDNSLSITHKNAQRGNVINTGD